MYNSISWSDFFLNRPRKTWFEIWSPCEVCSQLLPPFPIPNPFSMSFFLAFASPSPKLFIQAYASVHRTFHRDMLQINAYVQKYIHTVMWLGLMSRYVGGLILERWHDFLVVWLCKPLHLVRTCIIIHADIQTYMHYAWIISCYSMLVGRAWWDDVIF